jgi:hypothetical protein
MSGVATARIAERSLAVRAVSSRSRRSAHRDSDRKSDEAPFEQEPEAEIWVQRRMSWIPPVEGAAQLDDT